MIIYDDKIITNTLLFCMHVIRTAFWKSTQAQQHPFRLVLNVYRVISIKFTTVNGVLQTLHIYIYIYIYISLSFYADSLGDIHLYDICAKGFQNIK